MLLQQVPQVSEMQSASARPKSVCVSVSNGPFQTLQFQGTPSENESLFTFGHDL